MSGGFWAQRLLGELESVSNDRGWKKAIGGWISDPLGCSPWADQAEPPQWPAPVTLLKEPRYSHLLWNQSLFAVKTFLSSGTTGTGSTDALGRFGVRRSQSPFSAEGLFIYKATSIMGFAEVLSRTGYVPREFRGYSLIPPTTASGWQDSSLGQMIEWFSEFFEVEYVGDASELKEALSKKGSQPGWVFGTAAHFLQIHTPMAAASPTYVFETGGMKAPSALAASAALTPRNQTALRKDLYQHISELFGIPVSQVGSEYSASELASQAWSFREKTSRAPYEAPYYFPPYVKLSVEPACSRWWSSLPYQVRSQREEKEEKEEQKKQDAADQVAYGELCLWDPARQDFCSAMNMEDLVRIEADGGFVPLGRSLFSEQKGCSLRVSDVAGEAFKAVRAPASIGVRGGRAPSCEQMLGFIRELMASESWLAALAGELRDLQLAKYARDDLRASLPRSAEELIKARQQSRQSAFIDFDSRARVLVIAPRSHSVATLYHISFLLLLGCCVVVRVPRRFASQSPLRCFIDAFPSKLGSLTMVDESFRLQKNTEITCFEGVIAFASDTTVRSLSQLTAGVSQLGFGTRYGASMIGSPNKQKLQKAFKDFISLGQRGCMSSQLLCLPRSFYPQWRELTRTLSMPQMSLAEMMSLRRLHREFRLAGVPSRLIGSDVKAIYRKRSLGVKDSEDLTCQGVGLSPIILKAPTRPLSQYVHESAYVWPTIFYDDPSDMIGRLSSEASFLYLSTDLCHDAVSQSGKLVVRPLGGLNRDVWDGTFEGRPMFARESRRPS